MHAARNDARRSSRRSYAPDDGFDEVVVVGVVFHEM
jgi:hypothetical protein